MAVKLTGKVARSSGFGVKPVRAKGASHVHGPGCNHDHGGHDHSGHDHGAHDDHGGHDHGPGCGHDHGGHDDHGHHHHPRAVVPERPAMRRPAEDGGAALQLDLAALIPGERDELGRFHQLELALESRDGIRDVHLRKDAGRAEVCVHYDAEAQGFDQTVARVRKAAKAVVARHLVRSWFVRGMDSAQCATAIEVAVAKSPGVLQANVAYAAERLVVEYDREAVRFADLEARVKSLGFALEAPEHGHACSHHAHSGGLAPRLEMPLSVSAGTLLVAGLALEKLALAPPAVCTAMYLLAMAAGGLFAIRDAFNSLRQWRFDIETLTVVGGVGAALLGEPFEGALLLFLFSLGHSLEHRAMERARRAIEALGALRPETARVRDADGSVREVPVAEVQRGDAIVVRPGDRVPLDGIVREGHAMIDQATVTGESVPVARSPGESVFASTIVTDQAITVEVTRLAGESALARVIDMVAEAEAQKSPTQRFASRIERTFAPLVLVGAPVLAVVLVLLGVGWKQAIFRAVAVLVAASPCALAISTPSAVLSAVARAARGGVLMKGGAHLETLGKITAVAFDKTGTLTIGRPKLVATAPLDGVSEGLLLATAAGAEALSSHPLARAVVEGAQSRGIAPEIARGCEAVHGRGIRSHIGAEAVAVGSVALFEKESLPAAVTEAVARLESQGQTTMVVRRGERFLGVVGVADTLRSEARAALASLRALGIDKTVMLSGDNLRVATAVGKEVGIDEPRAPLMPEDKVSALRELVGNGRGVAMVGDGVNDAPALAVASVGIAMGGAGSDVALETADVVLMGDDLRKLPFAVALARDASRVVRQNVSISLAVSALLIVASVLGWVRISHAVVLHEGSTLFVVANALRLLAWRAPSGVDAG